MHATKKGLLCTLKLLSKGVKPKEFRLKHNFEKQGKNNKRPQPKEKKKGRRKKCHELGNVKNPT